MGQWGGSGQRGTQDDAPGFPFQPRCPLLLPLWFPLGSRISGYTAKGGRKGSPLSCFFFRALRRNCGCPASGGKEAISFPSEVKVAGSQLTFSFSRCLLSVRLQGRSGCITWRSSRGSPQPSAHLEEGSSTPAQNTDNAGNHTQSRLGNLSLLRGSPCSGLWDSSPLNS